MRAHMQYRMEIMMLNSKVNAPQNPVPRTFDAATHEAIKAKRALKTGKRSLIHEKVDIGLDTLY